jgi:2-methylisocitrate lyase-like PEP mutase family enzyme
MNRPTDLSRRFLDLHRKGEPLLLANAWDAGSAKLLASLGYAALATTSAGHAGSLGRLDGAVGRDLALEHARELAAATALPVSADLENCYADDVEGVAETVRLAGTTGLAGCSIEDYSGDAAHPIYPLDVAVARVEAAADAAHGGAGLVLTARCENHLRGIDDLGDTIARLQAYQAAGADVVYAPSLVDPDEIRQVVEAVDVPVNVLCRPGAPSVSELAAIGVARISVGGAFYFAALGALANAAREWREQGTHDFWQSALAGMQAGKRAFD